MLLFCRLAALGISLASESLSPHPLQINGLPPGWFASLQIRPLQQPLAMECPHTPGSAPVRQNRTKIGPWRQICVLKRSWTHCSQLEMAEFGAQEKETCGFSQQEAYNNTYWVVMFSLSVKNKVKNYCSISSRHMCCSERLYYF